VGSRNQEIATELAHAEIFHPQAMESVHTEDDPVLLIRRAKTNKVDDYENIYAMFFEVVDEKIHTQVEMLDFRVSTDKFDLSVLDR